MLRLRPYRKNSAKKLGLGVFENNPGAYYCDKAVGFKESR